MLPIGWYHMLPTFIPRIFWGTFGNSFHWADFFSTIQILRPKPFIAEFQFWLLRLRRFRFPRNCRWFCLKRVVGLCMVCFTSLSKSSQMFFFLENWKIDESLGAVHFEIDPKMVKFPERFSTWNDGWILLGIGGLKPETIFFPNSAVRVKKTHNLGNVFL